jgi:hypothetical protein
LEGRLVFNSAVSRRTLFRGLAGFLAGSPLLRSQQDPFRDHSRVPALREMLNAFDFEPVAYAKITRQAYDYMSWGVDGEFTMRRNREAYDWVGLVPRGLAGVAPVQTASTFLGMNLAYPIMISPTARHVLFNPDAEAATHAGATAASNTPFIVSNVATLPVEKIAAAATGPWWFQLYPQRGSDYNRQTLDKAPVAGRLSSRWTSRLPSTSVRRMTRTSPPRTAPWWRRLRSGRRDPAATRIASRTAGSGTNGRCSTNSAGW